MLMSEPTVEMIEEWKKIYEQYQDKLIPNKKEGIQIVEYLQNKYCITELEDKELKEIVSMNITANTYSLKKLAGANPIIRIFRIEESGIGKELYSNRDVIYFGAEILVGIELKTSYVFVEGSSDLYDELVTFSGLDEENINNYFLVAHYINCLQKLKKFCL